MCLANKKTAAQKMIENQGRVSFSPFPMLLNTADTPKEFVVLTEIY